MKKHCSKSISGCSAPSNTERKWRIQRERKKKQIAFQNEKQPYQNRPMVGVLSCPSLILLTAARVEWWNFLLSGGKIHTSTFCMDLFCIPTDTCESTAPQPPLHSHPWAVPAVSPGTSGQYASACEYTLALESFVVSSSSKYLLPFSSCEEVCKGQGMVQENTLWTSLRAGLWVAKWAEQAYGQSATGNSRSSQGLSPQLAAGQEPTAMLSIPSGSTSTPVPAGEGCPKHCLLLSYTPKAYTPGRQGGKSRQT